MAGVGLRLNKFFNKKSMSSTLRVPDTVLSLPLRRCCLSL